MAIKHAYVSPLPDPPNPALVGPSKWNDDHVVEDGSLAIAATAGLQAALDAKLPTSAASGFETAGAASAHEGAPDPHPQYTTALELASALSGYSASGHSHSGLAPAGGSTNQVLKKNSATDFDYSWQADSTGGGGGATPVEVTVDFGLGKLEIVADVTVTGATVGQKVIASPSLDMPDGVLEDELEMDMLACAGRVVSTNLVRLVVASLRGGIVGQRNINVLVG